MIDMLAGSPFFGLFFVCGYSFLANHMLDRLTGMTVTYIIVSVVAIRAVRFICF